MRPAADQNRVGASATSAGGVRYSRVGELPGGTPRPDEDVRESTGTASQGGRRYLTAWLLGLVALAVLCVLSCAVGSRSIPIGDVLTALADHDDSRESIIVWELRVPRTLLAVVCGAALAVAGVVMQAITRNPLAEPGILGVNSGASIAVVLAIAALGVATPAGYMWFAFVGAGVAAVVVFVLGTSRTGPTSHTRLVLAGIALSTSLSSFIGIITMFDSSTFDSYRFWVVGSLENRTMEVALWVTPFVVVGLGVALVLGNHFNALALGDEMGAALGLTVARVRVLGFGVVVILCGAATAAAGPIAFVGLVVPHAVRLVAGVDHCRNLALSLVAGPILLLASDIVGRLVVRPAELEVGIVTAFIGAPVLLLLILRARTGRS
ncbi:iron ABC transporter permease [Gordonia humi]|uniref:FecCD family ABC transporter permease n=1 Tax=Gordonia humi TaxID=686429 RepID=UPI0031E80646